MRTFVISLPSATDRRRHATEQLSSLGIDFEFFDAIQGTAATEPYFRHFDARSYRLNTQRDPLPGEIGCYASHLTLWQTCVDLDEPIVVLEDDFEVMANFPDAMPALEYFIEHHGFIRLESFRRRRAPLKTFRPIAYKILHRDGFELLYLSDVAACMTAYAINPNGAARLLSASATLVAPVDKFLQRTWEHKLPIYALSPPIVRTSSHSRTSTIGDRRARKSRRPSLLLARAFYKGLGELRRIRFDRAQLRRFGDGAVAVPNPEATSAATERNG